MAAGQLSRGARRQHPTRLLAAAQAFLRQRARVVIVSPRSGATRATLVAWMQEVERKYSQSMQRMLPHVPDTDELAIVGQSMATQLEAAAEEPVTLLCVMQRLQQTDPEAHALVLQLQEQQRLAAAQDVARAMEVRCSQRTLKHGIAPAL